MNPLHYRLRLLPVGRGRLQRRARRCIAAAMTNPTITSSINWDEVISVWLVMVRRIIATKM